VLIEVVVDGVEIKEDITNKSKGKLKFYVDPSVIEDGSEVKAHVTFYMKNTV